MNMTAITDFANRTVIVTGAGSGIGRATALAFAQAGANVLIAGRRAGSLASTAAGHRSISALPADLREQDAARRVTEKAMAEWGRVDVLVNNAGVYRAASLEQVTAQDVIDVMATNVVAPTLLASAALPHLKDSGGAIINVSSSTGQRPSARAAYYAASKAAIEQLTRCWALELAPFGVRVNAVAPGPTESEALAAGGLREEIIEKIKKAEIERIPLGRRGEPGDVATWILRLADPASTWLTGQILTVDGGVSLT
jgi:NAD(P)-dependent dehydrogenase (short-subunit alcohol dehydrogenase family)